MTLRERYDVLLDRSVESLKTWKDLITEYVDDDDDSTSEINKLKEVVEDYCHITRNFDNNVTALEKALDQLNEDDENSRNIEELYRENLKREKEKNTEACTESDIWQRVFEGVKDVMEVKRKKKKKLGDNEFEELEDSLFCATVFTPPIDPISKVVIREPMRSKKCKHVYERAMITDYIKQQKRKAKCPYIGCSSGQLLMSDIIPDSELQTQISQYMESHVDEDTEDDD